MKTTALITAGGSGTRFATSTPKQFLSLHGIPVIVRSIRAFQECDGIDQIIVTLPEAELPKHSISFFQQFNLSKVTRVVPGGANRQASVFRGLRAIEWECERVAVHDAARPLVTKDLVSKTLAALEGWDGAIAALPVRDTLKEVLEAPKISRTIPRRNLWAMQTPQVFRYPFILEAYKKADAERFEATDDAQLAERHGGRVRVVESESRNMKITFEPDLKLAEAILKGEPS